MSMASKDIHNNMKRNPFIDIDEDISIRSLQHLSFFEKIGLLSAFITSVIILLFVTFSLYLDIFIKNNYGFALVDIIIGLLMLHSLYYILNAFKGKIVTDILIETAFQDGVYKRLQPLIENIAKAHVDTNILIERINKLDEKVQKLSKEKSEEEIRTSDLFKEPIAIGTSIKFTIKSVFLITLTMAIFMFLVNFNLGSITQYFVLSIFFIWWVFITHEYKLWKDSTAWSFLFLIILLIPVSLMLLNNLLNYNVLIATLYFSVGMYTFIYYIWANYVTSGSLPIVASTEKEPMKNEFFGLQQKGFLKEILNAVSSRLEQALEKEEKQQDPDYAWKR